MANKCTGCYYWRPLSGVTNTASHQIWACHYALCTHQVRGCAPKDCNKFKRREGKEN